MTSMLCFLFFSSLLDDSSLTAGFPAVSLDSLSEPHDDVITAIRIIKKTTGISSVLISLSYLIRLLREEREDIKSFLSVLYCRFFQNPCILFTIIYRISGNSKCFLFSLSRPAVFFHCIIPFYHGCSDNNYIADNTENIRLLVKENKTKYSCKYNNRKIIY